MMSVCGYQSNISLSYEHVNQFFHSLHEHSHLDPALEAYIMSKDPADFASLKEVVSLIHSSYSLISVFDRLKRTLINSFVGKNNYLRICARMQYYNSYLDGFYLSPKPEEKCSEIISRYLVPKPPLLYTEYRKPDDDFKRIKASIIFEIRCKYGYCKIAERESPKSVLRYDLRSNGRRNRYMNRDRAKTDSSPIISFGSSKIHPFVITNPSSPSLLI